MSDQDKDTALYKAALLSVQEAAKQTGVVVPFLQAAYFAVISASDLKKAVWANWSETWWMAFLFVVPALLWLISLFLAIRVFVPPMVSAETEVLTIYKRVVRSKYRLLRYSQYILAAGLLVMVVNIIIYFVVIPPPPSPPSAMPPTLPPPTPTP
jgi:hypothetical protein